MSLKQKSMGWINVIQQKCSKLLIIVIIISSNVQLYASKNDSLQKIHYEIVLFGTSTLDLSSGYRPLPYYYNININFKPRLFKVGAFNMNLHLGLNRLVNQNIGSPNKYFEMSNRYQYGVGINSKLLKSDCLYISSDFFHFSNHNVIRSTSRDEAVWNFNFGNTTYLAYDFNPKKRSLAFGFAIQSIGFNNLYEGAVDPHKGINSKSYITILIL